MHRRSWILIAVIAVVLAAGATVGIVEARAQGNPVTADMTPAALLAKMAEQTDATTAVSGSLTWKNDLFGMSMFSLGSKGAGDFTTLLSGGSGRMWSQDGKARFEIQGGAGDTQVIADGAAVWVYSSGTNTATQYVLPEKIADALSGHAVRESKDALTTEGDPTAAIGRFIEGLAPCATLALEEPVKIAGRHCYVLALIPAADNTMFGSVTVAVDAETFLPLKLDVYAKNAAEAVVSVGFTSISYSSVDEDVFAFTPPPGASVKRKELSLPGAFTSGDHDGTDGSSAGEDGCPHGSLTIAEAAAQAGFTPLTARTDDPSLAFSGAFAIPAKEVDLKELSTRMPISAPVTVGPTIVQLYGKGFGTVMLAQAKVPAGLTIQLNALLGAMPFVGKTTVEGIPVYTLDSALGSITLWSRDGYLFLAGGSVSQSDLKEFIASVR